MKKFVVALAAMMALGAGAASAETIANSYGNTVVVTYPNGATARYFFNADNTFTATMPDGASIAGAFELANGQVCLTPAGGERQCTTVEPNKNVGDSWTQTGGDGSSIGVAIVAGR